MLFIKFATGVCHQQGGVREDRVCTWRAAQRWVHYSVYVVFVCWCTETCYLNSSVCVCSADLCRDQFSRCGVAALSGGCSSLGGSCGKSCGGCWSSTDIRDATCPHTAAFSTTLPHPLTLSSCSSPQFSPQCAFSCTTHYSCAKSTSAFDFLFCCPVYLFIHVYGQIYSKEHWWLYESLVL